MNPFERFSPLLPKNVDVLNESKNVIIAKIALWSLGFVFGSLMFFVLLTGTGSTGPAAWFFEAAIDVSYLFLIGRFVRQMKQIRSEIKRGLRKTVIIRLDDYSETAHYNRNGEPNYLYSEY